MKRPTILEREVPVRKKADKEERDIARLLGGSVIKGSGCMEAPRLKGDVDLQNFRVEVKMTESDCLTIQNKWLTKIRTEAAAINKFAALIITIGSGKDRWVCIPIDVFRELTKDYDNENQ